MIRNNKRTAFTERFLLWFAAANVVTCFAYIFLITFGTVPEKNQRYADVCLGFLLGTFLSTIIQFYYGSSHNAEHKPIPVDSSKLEEEKDKEIEKPTEATEEKKENASENV
jgi:hypothetical protein